MIGAVRLAVVAAVLVLLARVVPVAWRNRNLAVAVWRRVRPRHVLGSLVLLAAVLATAVSLLWFVPVTGYGAGSLVGLSGNAIFAPLEEALERGGGLPDAPPPRRGTAATATTVTAAQPAPWVVAVTVAFLGGLLLILPWLAYVEERVFREGLEHAPLRRQAWVALKFGLVHLVMLIPLAAAVAIGVAGFAYGRVYRRAYRRAVRTAGIVPVPVLRREAVLESTTWHVVFNSIVVLLVLAGFTGHWAFGW